MLEINELARLERDELIAQLMQSGDKDIIARALNIPMPVSEFLVDSSTKEQLIEISAKSLEKDDRLTIILRAFGVFEPRACRDASWFLKKMGKKLEEMGIKDKVKFISFETEYDIHDADLQYFHFIRNVKLLDENKNAVEHNEEDLEEFIEDELEFAVQNMFTDNYDMELEVQLF